MQLTLTIIAFASAYFMVGVLLMACGVRWHYPWLAWKMAYEAVEIPDAVDGYCYPLLWIVLLPGEAVFWLCWYAGPPLWRAVVWLFTPLRRVIALPWMTMPASLAYKIAGVQPPARQD